MANGAYGAGRGPSPINGSRLSVLTMGDDSVSATPSSSSSSSSKGRTESEDLFESLSNVAFCLKDVRDYDFPRRPVTPETICLSPAARSIFGMGSKIGGSKIGSRLGTSSAAGAW